MSKRRGSSCLIVDDEESIRLLIHDFLEDDGHLIQVASDKTSAFDLLSRREFDLIITDKNLPDGSGLEVIAEARQRGHESEIIVVTGYSDLESAIESFKYGVYRYIKKPFDLNALSVEVAGALRTHDLKSDLKRRTLELERTNTELQQSEARFRELAELLPGLVIETDAMGTLRFVNRSGLEITGYDPSSFQNAFATSALIDPSDRERWESDIARIVRGENVGVSEYVLVCADGRKLPALMQASHLLNADQPGGFRAVLMDITSRKMAESALREKETQLQLIQKMEAIGSLAGGVAHDFNNMIGVIRGYCDVIRFELHDNDPIADDIDSIVDAADRAADLTRQLLMFGRKQILVPRVINLNEVISSMEKMIKRLLREDIDIETRLAGSPLMVHVDKSQIEQVIMNLVVNARDAMPDGGSLVIEARRFIPSDGTPPQVQLTVEDTGIGMDEATRLRVFEPFFTTKQQGKGTGLGLATVYGIIHQSDGTISVSSVHGKGTSFTVRLPFAEAPQVDRPSFIPDAAELLGKETVLVVEDEQALLNVVSRILRGYGYSVLSASRGGDALLLCEKFKEPIDLLLVDVVMPRLNGAELAERLQRVHPEMAVLFMSGYSDFTVVRQVMSQNTDRFIPKPFSAKELAAKIREVLHLSMAPTSPFGGGR